MIKRNSEMKFKTRENMRDGDGAVKVTDVLSSEEYNGKARLVGVLTLEPGCSIGEHLHENEEEIFYILEGTATYNDNGRTEILNVGDASICKGGENHSIANKSDKTLKVFAVILTY